MIGKTKFEKPELKNNLLNCFVWKDFVAQTQTYTHYYLIGVSRNGYNSERISYLFRFCIMHWELQFQSRSYEKTDEMFFNLKTIVSEKSLLNEERILGVYNCCTKWLIRIRLTDYEVDISLFCGHITCLKEVINPNAFSNGLVLEG